jgi:putative hemolysin
MKTLFWILGATLATSFLCSVLEAVFLSVRRSHVALLRDQGHWAGSWLEAAQKKVDEPIAAILTLNTIANTMGAALGGAVAGRLFGSAAMGVFSAALTFSVLIFSEIVPKTLGATFWRQLAIPTAYVLRSMVWVMKPILIPLGWLPRLITPTSAHPTISRAELEVLAEIGRREGTLDEDEWQVVQNVIRLEHVSLAEVMTPRTDIIAVPVEASLEEATNTMLGQGHLRVPVFDGSLDHIVGILLGRDLWGASREGSLSVEQVMRPATFALESKPVEDLIPEMRNQRTKMAIVVDEFGGTAGLVTLEDLIEEIIGEIQDEHEADEPENFEDLPAGRVRVWGGTSLRAAGDRLHFTPSPEEEEGFDSLGGFIFGRLNRIPVVGDQVETVGGTLRVLEMNGRRVEYVVFVPHPRDTD